MQNYESKQSFTETKEGDERLSDVYIVSDSTRQPLLSPPQSEEGSQHSEISSDLPPSMFVLARQQGSAIVLYTLISYVVPTAIGEMLTSPKSLPVLLLGSVTVSFSMEAIKLFFNASAILRKDFNLYWGADAVQAIVLMTMACGFYFLEMGKSWSPVGYNAAVMVPGIVFKLLNDFVIAPLTHKYLNENVWVNQWLFPINAGRANEHENRWYNHTALHFARFIILLSAMIAGSELFEKMKISETESIGGDLVALFELCGAKGAAAIYASALLTNEEIGMTFFLGSNWFKGMHASYTSRLIALVGMAALFQALSNVLSFLKEENLGVLLLAATVTFFADLAVQYSFGPKIDKPVNRVVASAVDSVVEISKAALIKCGFCAQSDYQLASQNVAVENPMVADAII